MPPILISSVVAALTLAGCGSGRTAHPTPSATPTTSTSATIPTSAGAALPIPTTYTLLLTGAGVPALSGGGSAGVPHGSGSVTLRFIPNKGRLCWRFSELIGVSSPTHAALTAGPAGGFGTVLASLGKHYVATGCTSVPANVLSSESQIDDFNVTVYSRKYASTGAIRGQL